VVPEDDEAAADREHNDTVDDGGRALRRVLDAVRAIGADLAELARVGFDLARLGVRERTFGIVLCGWLLLVFLAVTTLAIHLLLQGLTGGVARVLGGPGWLAQLVVGVGVLLGTGAGFGWWRWRLRRNSLAALRRRYPGDAPEAKAGDPS